MAAAFGMKVIGTKRRPEKMANVDEVLPPERTDEVLAQSDFCCSCCRPRPRPTTSSMPSGWRR